jgi:hypothetical protein
MATTTTTSNATLPEHLQGYVPDLFARSQALTSSQPYTPYGGQRVAGLAPLQQQAAGSLSGINAGNLITQGTNLTQQGAQYDPSTSTFDTTAAQKYMDPYAQGVTDIAKREAQRNSNIAATYDASKAAQAGAFGGSRQAVMDAERERNLQTTLSDLDTRGLSAAYLNSQQQFNADQQRQQQDRQFASTAALRGGQDLTQGGGQAFGLQSTAGLLEQGNQQQNLDTAYADFLSNQAHPYEQLQFQRNILSGFGGTPNTTTVQEAPGQPSRSGLQQFGDVVNGVGQIWDTFFKAGGGHINSREPETRSGLGHGRVSKLLESMA